MITSRPRTSTRAANVTVRIPTKLAYAAVRLRPAWLGRTSTSTSNPRHCDRPPSHYHKGGHFACQNPHQVGVRFSESTPRKARGVQAIEQVRPS